MSRAKPRRRSPWREFRAERAAMGEGHLCHLCKSSVEGAVGPPDDFMRFLVVHAWPGCPVLVDVRADAGVFVDGNSVLITHFEEDAR